MTDRQTEAMSQFDRAMKCQNRAIGGLIICLALLGLCLAYLQGA